MATIEESVLFSSVEGSVLSGRLVGEPTACSVGGRCLAVFFTYTRLQACARSGAAGSGFWGRQVAHGGPRSQPVLV